MAFGVGAFAVATLAATAYQAYRSKREAEKQRGWQERMSNSAYQRSMDDMRLAGLNPMLAYQQGGAGTPSGGMAKVPDMGSAVVTALHAKRLGAELELMKAQTGKATAEASLIGATELRVGKETEKVGQQTQNLLTENQIARMKEAQRLTTGDSGLGKWLTTVYRIGKLTYVKIAELAEEAKKMGAKDRLTTMRLLRSLGWKSKSVPKKKGHKHGGKNKKALRGSSAATL